MHPAWWEAGDAELEGNRGLARVGDCHQAGMPASQRLEEEQPPSPV